MAPYTITRSAFIPAPPEAVFPLVNSFREWAKWSPWEGMDASMERSYSGPEAGVGAVYSWKGNRKVGAGSMQILESEAPNSVRIRLVFVRPFRAVNPTGFTFEPDHGGTRVTWAMKGENKGLARLFAKVVDMDRLVGRDFEKGLASLARAVGQDG
ncbi:SRPBCC family protein [Sinomonas halotolerans]|uniref:SRPBCC family protein n=1 Tax=Sinomonas halotolerans TaxID=1644133 RepID=A0ABU9WZ73_9MICC